MIKHIFIWIFLLCGFNTLASHVLGGELSYQHIKDNQYKVFLNIYRDCNGCKINGNGGGNGTENCSEIDYIIVKGYDNSSAKETKFSLTRESITDISPLCNSKISSCKINPNTSYGIELHQFTSIIDLDNSKIKGFCNYKLYITLAERNEAITTGQSQQNFCIDAFINSCISSKNNSPTFVHPPTFLVNHNKSFYQSSYAIEKDNDSLVYNLTPALHDLDRDANYGMGFSYNNPLSVYCIEPAPCAANKEKETGFYLDHTNGSTVFIPVQNTEIGIVAIKIEEYRKVSGKWILIGYIKRDYQISVKTNDGNNLPKFTNKDYFEICEAEPLVIKIETKDDRNAISSQLDTNSFKLTSAPSGCSFIQYAQNTAPYHNGLFKWTPPIGASDKGIYKISIAATDNNCVLNGQNQQVITIKVLAKEKIQIHKRDLGCGNYELKTTSISNKSSLILKVYRLEDLSKIIFTSTKTLDTLSSLQKGTYLISLELTSPNGCVTSLMDTLKNLDPKLQVSIAGNDSVCRNTFNKYSLDNLIHNNFKLEWSANEQYIDTGLILNTYFSKPTSIQVILSCHSGKWKCQDTIGKFISLIKMPKISLPDPFSICQKSGLFDLSTLSSEPKGGVWVSTNTKFSNGGINTNIDLTPQDDTIQLNYEISHSGCKTSKALPIVLMAVPEFELSNFSICEVTSPVFFEHLIKKPSVLSGLKFSWNLPLFQSKIKDVNGSKAFFPNELGFGTFTYNGMLMATNGCKNFDTANIEITEIVKIQLMPELTICQESGLINITELAAANPDNGQWFFSKFDLIQDNKFVKTDSCGIYTLSYTYDNYGCYDQKSLKLIIACKPTMKILNPGNAICDTRLPIPLEALPLGGKWSGDYITSNIFNPPKNLNTTDYTIHYTISDDQCQFREHKLIKLLPSPILDISLNNYSLCYPKPITLSGSVSKTNSLSFTYLNDSSEIKVPGSGVFYKTKLFESKFNKLFDFQSLKIVAQNEEGCSVEKEFSIKVYDSPNILPFKDTFICENSNYTITPQIRYDGNEPLVFSWIENLNEINTSRNLSTTNLFIGQHKFSFICGNLFCSDSKPINLDIKAKPFVDFMVMPTEKTTITQPSFWFVNQSTPNQNWLWNFGSTQKDNTSTLNNAQHSYSDTGNYRVSLTGTDLYGCSDTRYKTVVVRPDLLIFIPNAFSPNQKDEEKNNVFSVSLENYNSYSLEIYNRWGHKMFYSENPNETWDGKLGSTPCTPDIYFYSIKINSISNHDYHYKGTILLLK